MVRLLLTIPIPKCTLIQNPWIVPVSPFKRVWAHFSDQVKYISKEVTDLEQNLGKHEWLNTKTNLTQPKDKIQPISNIVRKKVSSSLSKDITFQEYEYIKVEANTLLKCTQCVGWKEYEE